MRAIVFYAPRKREAGKSLLRGLQGGQTEDWRSVTRERTDRQPTHLEPFPL